MSDLARLRDEMVDAQRAYWDAKRRYEAAAIAAQTFKPGDVIKSTKGELAQVVSISMRYGLPDIFAVQRKRDGTFGKRRAPTWRPEWEKPEVVSGG